MAISELSLLAVFLTGLLGGVHCAGMCGGIVSALGMLQQKPPVSQPSTLKNIDIVVDRSGADAMQLRSSPRSAIQSVAFYNLGRITTYILLGFMAGGIGSSVWLMQSLLPVQQVAFFLSNLILISMGLYVMGFKRIGAITESLGSPLWRHIRPAATRRLTGTGALNCVVAGSLWGLVPCGMVYAVLGAALVSGNAINGAVLMLMFGLGTLPNLMALGLSGQWLARASRNRVVRRIAGGLIIGFGLMGFMHLMMQRATIS